jgi:hypothetical protein
MGRPKAMLGIGQEISILSLMLSLNGDVQKTEKRNRFSDIVRREHIENLELQVAELGEWND